MSQTPDAEYEHWNATFAGDDYFYGLEPGPVARRAVRYHRALQTADGCALDIGCGEGQDVLFLAQSGYKVTGLELTHNGLEKTRRLLQTHAITEVQMWQRDLQNEAWTRDLGTFEVVLAINCLQFLGKAAPNVLRQTLNLAAPNGIVGLSVFAREESEPIEDNAELWLPTRDELLEFLPGAQWQPLEVAQLWQWGMPKAGEVARPRMFVTVVARRAH